MRASDKNALTPSVRTNYFKTKKIGKEREFVSCLIPLAPRSHPSICPRVESAPNAAIGTVRTADAPDPKATGLL